MKKNRKAIAQRLFSLFLCFVMAASLALPTGARALESGTEPGVVQGLEDKTDQASGDSEQPGDSEAPEAPADPAVPENSEAPETPETPENPGTPETPETSETPETPETPEELEETESPVLTAFQALQEALPESLQPGALPEEDELEAMAREDLLALLAELDTFLEQCDALVGGGTYTARSADKAADDATAEEGLDEQLAPYYALRELLMDALAATPPTMPEGTYIWYTGGYASGMFTISAGAELRELAELVNGTAKDAGGAAVIDDFSGKTVTLAGNIDIGGADWFPIGGDTYNAATTYFKGVFDGNGKTVGGLQIGTKDVPKTNGVHSRSSETLDYVGLFGCISGATIEDLTVEGAVYIGVSSTEKFGQRTGGVVGSSEGGSSLARITNKATVSNNGAASTNRRYVGGVAGYTKDTKITYCVNYGAVTGGAYVGGIAGGYSESVSTSLIENCENHGAINADNTSAGYIGGVAGRVNQITDCTNSGSVTYTGTNSYTGGVAGGIGNTTVSGLENNGPVTADNGAYVGGVAGDKVGGAGSIPSNPSSGCTNNAAVSGKSSVGGVFGRTAATAKECRNTGAVTASGGTVGGIAGELRNANQGVVDSTNTGMVTSSGINAGGIVGTIGANSANIKISGCANRGDVSSTSSEAGGLIGYGNTADSSVTASSSSGNVKGTTNVGGLVGRGKCTISTCYNTGTVKATAVGGIAGGLAGTATASVGNCYTTGAVTGDKAGQLAGSNASAVTGCFAYVAGSTLPGLAGGAGKSCYILGSASAGADASGVATLTAEQYKEETLPYELDNASVPRTYVWMAGEKHPLLTNDPTKASYKFSYKVKGGNDPDGGSISVKVDNKTIDADTDNFVAYGKSYEITVTMAEGYTVQLEGLPENAEAAARERTTVYTGTVKADAAFTYVFYIPGSGSGFEEEPEDGVYVISTADDLLGLSALVSGGRAFEGKTIRLANDIDVSGRYFEAIGTQSNPFKGSFDGQGHSVTLNIDTDDPYQGLFGCVGSASGETPNTISNVTIKGRVKSTGDYVGGVAGSASAPVTGCRNESAVTGAQNVGGIVGSIGAYDIKNCANLGAVSGTQHVGGICGIGSPHIDSCYHAGSVSAASRGGGIAGNYQDSTPGAVSNSFSYDAATPFAGYINASVVKNSYALYKNDPTGGVTVKTAEEFTALELVWLLDAGGKETRTFNWAPGERYPVFSTAESKAVYRVHAVKEYGSAEGAGSVTVGAGETPVPGAVAYGEAGDAYAVTITQLEPETYSLYLTGIPEDAVEEPAGTYSGTLAGDIDVFFSFDTLGDSSWLEPEGDEYELATADQLVALRTAVNRGNTFKGKTIRLTADIDMSGKTFMGIGSEEKPFMGSFDGQTHTISGLNLQTAEQDNRGFFTGIENATVKNLTVGGVITGRDNTGLLAGCPKGSTVFENCFVAAGSSISGRNCAGGLIGRAGYGISVVGCETLATGASEGLPAANVSVRGAGTAGGLVGLLEAKPEGATPVICVQDSVSRAVVETTGSSAAGSYGGGVAGRMEAGTAVQNCRNEGPVSSYQYSGGIVGAMDKLAAVTGCVNSAAVEAGSGRYVGGIAGAADDGCVFTGCVNEQTGTISQTSCLGGIVGFASAAVSLADCKNEAAITGTSDYIGGILGQAGEMNAYGLAAFTKCSNSGAIKGGSNVGGVAGGVAGSSSCYISAQLADCTNSGGVTGADNLGGIVGLANYSTQKVPTKLSGCSNSGTVSGTGVSVGGVGGSVGGNYIVVENCSNLGSVSSTTNRAAGILGGTSPNASSYWKIIGCSNSGNIEGKTAYGIAYTIRQYAAAENCRNSGTVTATGGDAAGIAGTASNAMRIKSCYNTGSVTATGNAAGIINGVDGFLQDQGGIQDCYNTGRITGSGVVAGVLGKLDKAGYLEMRYCYNTGEIVAGASSTLVSGVFGAVGRYSYPSYCYNAGNITSAAAAPTGIGGVVAKAETDTFNYVKYSHNYGKITVANAGAAAVTGAVTGGSVISAKGSNLYYRTDCVALTDGSAMPPVDAGVCTEKTEAQFKLAEVAYLLDNGANPLRTYHWSQGENYPVLAASDETAVYRVTVESVANGTLVPAGENYGVGGSAMSFTVKPEAGYKLDKLTLKDTDGISYAFTVNADTVAFAMPTADSTLTASFVSGTAEDKEYTATFISGDQTFASVQVKSGNTLAAPAEKPVLEGYVFKGWYTSAAYTDLYDFNSLVFGNITLYAKWVEEGSETVTVSFNLNGADGQLPEKQVITIGGLVRRPAAPTWTSSEDGISYNFSGWYTARVGGVLWDFDNDQPTEDMTLWAHWTKQDIFSSGTAENPYVFKTGGELEQLADNVAEGKGYGGCYFKLGIDITIDDAGWSGLGYIKADWKHDLTELSESGTVPFNGNFDGGGHTITLNPRQIVAVFGAVGSTGVVYNLNVVGVLDPAVNREMFGGVASVNFGTIDTCNVVLTGDGDDADGNVSSYAGGIVGGLAAGTIKNCTATVQLYNHTDGIKAFGGIAGYVVRGGVEGCTVKAGSTILADKPAVLDYGVGGIAGTMTSDTRANGQCAYMTGCTVEQGVTITGYTIAGGLAGIGTIMEDCRVGADVYVTGVLSSGEHASASAFAGAPQSAGESGVSNSYYYGSCVQGTGDLIKDLHVTNCYYAFVDNKPADGSASSSAFASYKTEEQLASGEVAYLLDGGGGAHRHVWTQGTESEAGYPVQGTPSYYWIKELNATHGTISIGGKTESPYRAAGSTVQVTVTPEKYINAQYGPQYAYKLSGLTVTDVNGGVIPGSIDELRFVMPEGDVGLVAAVFTRQQTGYVEEQDGGKGDDPGTTPNPDTGTGTGSGTGTGEGGDGEGAGENPGGGEGTGATDNSGVGESGNPSGETAQDSNQHAVTLGGQTRQTQPADPVISEPLEEKPEEPEEKQAEEPQPPEQPKDDENLLDQAPEITETTRHNIWPVIVLIAAIAAAALTSFLVLLSRKRKKETITK
ncbi:Listeria/Bacterioides repeat-containing protein [Sporobacter termitidis DSM 10068]|uniref:Listeria/Bacterioides repeat-containing protein n=1 Tax=Sporobacter termitidis DSM 10068 TaxID=1123282 RepID=A0A1M5YQD7_9FIRM|nr:InlB B-repeat-containing protein [Sporobacter termitidis]SHI14252.1 Listeria/Bacterioides repeat-containing protein [Sporobacter termitidis DSM 10068]